MNVIIITRPAPLQQNLCAQLEALHQAYVHLPAATLQSTNAQASKPVDIAIFLSPASVLYAPSAQSIQIAFAVGAQTAQAVTERFGYPCHYPQQKDTGVMALLADHTFIKRCVEYKSLVIFGAGDDLQRFAKLSATMHMTYCKTHTLTTLRTPVQLTHQLPATGEIWFTSFKLMQLFCTHYITEGLTKQLLTYDIVVPSIACLELAKQVGFKGRFSQIEQPTDTRFLTRISRNKERKYHAKI